ncbi:MAG: hypothetical protein HOV87_12205 [Catenulispora sp.]|nr:hypothetical protein [Catenulispora sp.]NUT39990.1 hypothetical protein [Thermoactinospora sp.]
MASQLPGAQHHTEVGEYPEMQMTSASCTCGWSKVFAYARPTGAVPAARLARMRAELHEKHPEERYAPE